MGKANGPSDLLAFLVDATERTGDPQRKGQGGQLGYLKFLCREHPGHIAPLLCDLLVRRHNRHEQMLKRGIDPTTGQEFTREEIEKNFLSLFSDKTRARMKADKERQKREWESRATTRTQE
jgi:hypothetical protein